MVKSQILAVWKGAGRLWEFDVGSMYYGETVQFLIRSQQDEILSGLLKAGCPTSLGCV